MVLYTIIQLTLLPLKKDINIHQYSMEKDNIK